MSVEQNTETGTYLVPMNKLAEGLTEFNEKKAQLTQLAEQAAKIQVDGIEDKENFEKAVTIRKKIKEERIGITKLGKSLRDLVSPITKGILSKEKELLEILTPQEERLLKIEEEIENQKEKIRQEKNRKKEEQLNNRINILLRMGMAYNGIDYSLNEVKITTLEVINHDEKSFTEFLSTLKKEVDRIAEEKEQADKINTLREFRKQELANYNYEENDMYGLPETLTKADLGTLSEEEYSIFLGTVKRRYDKLKKEKEAEQKAKEERFKKREIVLIDLGYKRENGIYRHEHAGIIPKNFIEEYIDGDWSDLVAKNIQIIEDKNTLLKLQADEKKRQQESIALHNQKIEQRTKELCDMGLVYNGSEFRYQDVNISGTEMNTLDSFEWKTLISKIKPIVDEKKKQEDEAAREKIRKEEKLKLRIEQINGMGIEFVGDKWKHNKFPQIIITQNDLEMEEKEYCSFLETVSTVIKNSELEEINRANALLSEKEQLIKWVSSITIQYRPEEGINTEQGKKLYAEMVRNFDAFIDGSKKMINQLK